FTQPRACHCQQTEKAIVGPRPQTIRGGKMSRGFQQLADFLVRVEIRTRAPRASSDQTNWRDLGGRISTDSVAGKTTYGRVSGSFLFGFVMRMEDRELHCQSSRDVRSFLLFQERNEFPQIGSIVDELKPQ